MNDQRSVTEQLKDIYVLAVKAGHYDGADIILKFIEQKQSPVDNQVMQGVSQPVQNAGDVNVSLMELVDGALPIVEIFDAESPSQIEWKKNWIKTARKLVG